MQGRGLFVLFVLVIINFMTKLTQRKAAKSAKNIKKRLLKKMMGFDIKVEVADCGARNHDCRCLHVHVHRGKCVLALSVRRRYKFSLNSWRVLRVDWVAFCIQVVRDWPYLDAKKCLSL